MAQKVLVVGADVGTLQQALPILKRAELAVESVGRCQDAVGAVKSAPFALVIAHVPSAGAGLDDLVAALRAPGSPSRSAGLVVVADRGRESEAERYRGHGANHVLSTDALNERLPPIVNELLAVAPRQAVRVALRLELSMRFGTSRTFGTTENVSTSGMLVRGCRSFPVGTLLAFQLTLPSEGRPVGGEVRVARDLGLAKEALDGLGVKFISFTDDSQQRLVAFLAGRLP